MEAEAKYETPFKPMPQQKDPLSSVWEEITHKGSVSFAHALAIKNYLKDARRIHEELKKHGILANQLSTSAQRILGIAENENKEHTAPAPPMPTQNPLDNPQVQDLLRVVLAQLDASTQRPQEPQHTVKELTSASLLPELPAHTYPQLPTPTQHGELPQAHTHTSQEERLKSMKAALYNGELQKANVDPLHPHIDVSKISSLPSKHASSTQPAPIPLRARGEGLLSRIKKYLSKKIV